MIIEAFGMMDSFKIAVDTGEAYKVAKYTVISDPAKDKVLKSLLVGKPDVYGFSISSNGTASPWGIINALEGMGYVVNADEYKVPERVEYGSPPPDLRF